MRDSLGRKSALTVQEALNLLHNAPLNGPSTERVRIDEAYGRVIAEDVRAPEALPGFRRSSMDGFAVVAADTFGVSETMPSYLRVVGEVLMGEAPGFSIKRGETAAISTGGMLPEGADAVVMLEHVNMVDGENIEVMKQVAPGENVIGEDEDIKAGEILLRRGQRLRPQDIGALAGVGITEIRVYRRPRVGIISTGDEVVPPDSRPAPGQVRDINSYNLFGLVLQEGGIPVRMGIIRDDIETLRAVLKEAKSSTDMVLLTGGSSVGVRDYAEEVIQSLGSPGVLFHGVRIKPGKPLLAGVVDGVAVFALPGHPAAVTVCFEVFVRPVLQRLSGLIPKDVVPPTKVVRATLAQNIPSVIGREEYVRVQLRRAGSKILAEPIFGKSGLILTLLRADGLVRVPSEVNGLYRDEEVEVMVFGD